MAYEKYIGIPYVTNGRTEEGVDCWGLVRLFYRDELNIDLPSYDTAYYGPSDDERIASLMDLHKGDWSKQDNPKVGDVCVFNILGEPCHVGIYIGNNKFLHSRENRDSVIESLDNVKWKNRLEGIYAPGVKQQITTVGMPHPLKTTVFKDWTVAGTSARDFVNFVKEKYKVSDRLSSRLVLMVDGEVIPMEAWDTTILQHGQTVAYRSVPEGKDSLRMVLTLVVIVAAVWIAGPEGFNLGAQLGSAMGIGTTAGTALATAGLTMAGMALINAILPIRPPNDPGTPLGVSLFTGASNQSNKFGSIPVVLGKVRMTGMLGATTYVETLTDTSLLNLLIVWGFGPLDISDICVGTNPIVNYYTGFPQEVPRPAILYGYDAEDTASFDKLYAQDVEQQFKQIELVNNESDGNPSSIISFVQQSTSVDVTFTFPEGMRQLVVKGDNAGNVNPATAGVEIKLGTVDNNNNITWLDSTAPYSVGNYSSPTPSSNAYTNVLQPAYFTTSGLDGEANTTALYRYSTYAMVPGGGISRFDGTATDVFGRDPSQWLLNIYKGGSYANLIGSDTTYSAIPKLPPSYIKLHTVCIFGGTGVYDVQSHLGNYPGVQGLTLTSESILTPSIDGDGFTTLQNTGTVQIKIAAGRVYQDTQVAAVPGQEQTIFTSASFPSTVRVGNLGCQFLKDYGIWGANNDPLNLDVVTNVTFPQSGYYSIEASADDEGGVYINGYKVLDIPRPGYNATVKALQYLAAGTYPVRLKGLNSGGGGKAAACKITFTANSGLNTPATPYTELVFGSQGFFYKRKDAFNFVYRIMGLERKRYAVQVRRTNSDVVEPSSDLRNYHKVIFYSATCYDNTKPMVNPPGCHLARTAIRVPSTNKANGNIEGVNALVQTIALDWDSSVQKWITRQTNNPASLFLYVLTHPANAFKVDKNNIGAEVDLPTLQEWHEYCNNSTVKLTYNDVVTSTKSVMDVLRDICAAGKASPTYVNGKWSVVVDKPRTHTVQFFTQHNSWGFESTKILPKLPDAFRISIANEAKAYQPDEILVYNYGFNADGSNGKKAAVLFESLSLPGVTNREQAIHLAQWHFAQLKLRPELYTINTDFEYLVCSRGDLVKVTHAVAQWGLGSGRIGAVENGSISLHLTEDMYLEVGKTYRILIRTNNIANNSVVTVTKTLAAVAESGWYNNVELTAPVQSSDGIEVDNLFMLGELGKETQELIVIGIEPSANGGARLTLVDYSPEIYTANLSELLVFNPNITAQSNYLVQNTITAAPVISSVTSDSALSEEISTGTYQNILIIGFSNQNNLTRNAEKIQVQLVTGDSEFQDASPGNSYFILKELASLTVSGLQTGRPYKIRARYTNASGSMVGPWCDIFYTTNTGKSQNTYTVATLVLDLEGTYITAIPTVTSNKPANFKTYEYRLYKDTGTEDFWELDPATNNILVVQSIGMGRLSLLDMPHPRLSTEGITYRVACRALDNTNNYSAESALGTIVLKTIQ